MSCNNLISIIQGADCSNNSGGIYTAYIIDQASITATTVVTSAWTVTNIAATEPFTTFEFRRNVGSTSSEPTIDLINGSTFYANTVNFVFHRREASKSRALNILSEGQRYLAMIILDANGLYWYYDYLQLTAGAEESGTARADGSKYTVIFAGESNNRVYEVDPAIIPGLI